MVRTQTYDIFFFLHTGHCREFSVKFDSTAHVSRTCVSGRRSGREGASDERGEGWSGVRVMRVVVLRGGREGEWIVTLMCHVGPDEWCARIEVYYQMYCHTHGRYSAV